MALPWIEPGDPMPWWIAEWIRNDIRQMHTYTIAPLHPNEEQGTAERYLLFEAAARTGAHQVWLHANTNGADVNIRLVSCLEDAEQIVRVLERQQEALIRDEAWSREHGFRQRRLERWLAGQGGA